MTQIQVGDPAPEFTVTSHTGTPLCLSEFLHQKVVVLFFYPKDGTAVCTKEACAFRDAHDQFVTAGAVVIGVSGDSTARHGTFATSYNLPFSLVSDGDGSLRKAFGVPKTLGILPGRVTYVIDQEGIVRLIFNAQLTATRHANEALKVVGELANP